jgi:hypothetical protein
MLRGGMLIPPRVHAPRAQRNYQLQVLMRGAGRLSILPEINEAPPSRIAYELRPSFWGVAKLPPSRQRWERSQFPPHPRRTESARPILSDQEHLFCGHILTGAQSVEIQATCQVGTIKGDPVPTRRFLFVDKCCYLPAENVKHFQ